MTKFILILSTLLFAQAARTPNQADFFSHKQSGDPIELWSYHFVFDNGTQAWLTYSLVDLPAIGEKVAAELSFYRFQGKNKSVGKQFDRKEWHQNSSANTLSVRQSYAMEKLPVEGHRVRFSTSKNEDYALDLTFKDAEPGLAADPQKLEGVDIYSVIHIPRGHVEGTISIGKQSLHVTGLGSLVHTWHAKPATDFAKNSVSFFSTDGKVLCGRILESKSGNKVGGFAVTVENGKPKLLIPKSIATPKNGATITWTDASEPPLTLNFANPFQKYSTLSTVDSWMERQAAKIAMGGERILFRGTSKLNTGTIQWVATGFED